MNRLKLAELTSGAGALVLGVGLGALFSHWFGPMAGLIEFAGTGSRRSKEEQKEARPQRGAHYRVGR